MITPGLPSPFPMHDPVAWLYGLQSHGIKLGLDGIRALLDALDRPDRDLPIVLVGGTNGKGSVASMLDAMLAAHGRSTGLYTSPHLIRPNERIRVGGRDVASPDLDRWLATVRSACERGLASGRLKAHPSFFEVITAVALLAFREEGVEAAILEVGLGGRLDATNATEPSVAAIVTIDLDHVSVLGGTLRQIAIEKAGIARAGRPLVSGVTQPEAIAAIRERCAAVGAMYRDARETPLTEDVRLSLEGDHQRANARVAVATLEAFMKSMGWRVDAEACVRGLESARWPGRLQWIPGTPRLLLDGAHNAAGSAALAAYLAARHDVRPVLLLAAMADKDLVGILGPLAPHLEAVITTKPSVARAGDPDALVAIARDLGLDAEAREDTRSALEAARRRAGSGGIVLVAGSLYLVGEVLGIVEGSEAPGPVSM